MNMNWDGDRHWKFGVIYYDPDDKRVVVTKREGFGRTLNMGRPISWLIMAGPVVVAVIAVRYGSR